MRDNLIRWKKDDYRELEKAVNSFNRKIKRLDKKELNIPLPNPVNAIETRKEIRSRKELNRVIKSLRDFSKKGAEDIRTLKSGTKITNWEYKEITKARTRAKRRLTREANKIRGTRSIQLGMGDERLDQIESIIESFENLENKKGFEFKRTAESIMIQGSVDFNIKKAETFRANFMESIKEASSLENYDKLVKKLDSIKNPVDFYEKVNKSTIAMDFGVWYKEVNQSDDTISYGAFATSQEMFNQMLVELDVF